jgi:hypothetical protein
MPDEFVLFPTNDEFDSRGLEEGQRRQFIGFACEHLARAELLSLGVEIAEPSVAASHGDIWAHDGGRFVRIQCKKGTAKNGKIWSFNLVCRDATIWSDQYQTAPRRSYTHDEVDIFALVVWEMRLVKFLLNDGSSTRHSIAPIRAGLNGDTSRRTWDYCIGIIRRKL